MATVNEQHVQPRLGQQTVTQYRRGKRLHKLPAKFTLDLEHLPITEGCVIFIRWITARGKINLLGQTFRVGPGHKYHYAKVVLDTRRRRLTVYVVGKVLKRWPYKLSHN